MGCSTEEFPSLSGFTLADAQTFAGKSQEVLVAKKTFDGSSPSEFLTLPLISPHPLHHRLHVDQDASISIIMRKSYPLLKNIVESFDFVKHCGIYLRGPTGIGKSYLLYLLASEFRSDRAKYRVTYVNDCAMWRTLGFYFFLEELITTFYDDTINNQSIVEWANTFEECDSDEKKTRMIFDLIAYIRKHDLRWVVIIDQHNALFNPSVVRDFPFSLLYLLSENRRFNITVVISASLNNVGYPSTLKGWLTHEIVANRFDDEEFKVWCDHYLLNGKLKVEYDSEEALDALFWNGGVPYELDLLWNQETNTNTLTAKTTLYRGNRLKEMAEGHAYFCRDLTEEKTHNLEECVCRMALGMAPPNIEVGMNRQLFHIIPDNVVDGKWIIAALNPIAREALITYHVKDKLMNSLGFAAEIVFYGDFTKDIKGRIIEKYMTTMLELSKRFSFQARKLTKSGTVSKIFVSKIVEIRNIFHFSGNKVPSQRFNYHESRLFIPSSPNYPGFDFFIWNHIDEVIMAFQVTVQKPFTGHSMVTDRESENYKLWLNIFFERFGKPVKSMEVYWITHSTCLGKSPNFFDHIILLDDFLYDFPALLKLRLG